MSLRVARAQGHICCVRLRDLRARGYTADTPMLRNNRVLWIIQILLAALYLFTGGLKLFGPAEAMQPPGGQPQPLPIWFLRMIGGFEILGALGLILPGLTGIRRNLTPIAAGCLTIIMIGAVISTVAMMGVALAVLPLVAGALDLVVLNGRLDWLSAPARGGSHETAALR
jgi:DoxX-like family